MIQYEIRAAPPTVKAVLAGIHWCGASPHLPMSIRTPHARGGKQVLFALGRCFDNTMDPFNGRRMLGEKGGKARNGKGYVVAGFQVCGNLYCLARQKSG